MKKIIFSLIAIIFIVAGYNFTYGLRVTDVEVKTYICAENTDIANAKMQLYGTNENSQAKNKEQWNAIAGTNKYLTLNTAWGINKRIYTTYYLKYIFKEELNGELAFCLDPGLKTNTDYEVLNVEKKSWGKVEGKKQLTEKEKIYATIYNADFNYYNFAMFYSMDNGKTWCGLPRDDMTDYIIKQLLFWAYEANNDLFTIYAPQGVDNVHSTEIQYTYKVLDERNLYPNAQVNYKYTSTNILEADIYAAILHYASNSKYKDYDYYKNTINGGGAPQDGWDRTAIFKYTYNKVGNHADGIIGAIEAMLTESYKELATLKPEEVSITRYVPKDRSNLTTHQEFIGIYAPPEEDKEYAVLVKKDGNYYKANNYPNEYTKLTDESLSIVAENISDYRYKGYDVYKSKYRYNTPTGLLDNVVTKTSDTAGSYELVKKNAAEYNVIVLNYEKINYGTLKVQKKIRYNDGTESAAIDEVSYTLNKNIPITISSSLTSGGTTYYYFKHVNGSTTTYHDSDLSVTIPKSESNVTLTIYYGLRRIDYAHKIGDSTTLESGTIYRYNSWGSIPNLVSAKSTPLYWTLGNTYVKLNYVKGKYKNATTTVAESAVTYGGTDKGTDFTSTSFGLGALGNKDNDSTRIHFYYNVVDSTKVVVRHFVKQNNGTYALNNGLANSQTVVYNGEQAYSGVAKSTYVIVNNNYSQRKSIVKNTKSVLNSTEISALYGGSYSEFYEIDKNDKIIIDRSRILLSDGIYYKCLGFKTNTTTSSTNPFTNITSSGVNTTSSLTQTISNTSGYVYIDYYYDPVSYSPDVKSIGDTARLKYMTKAAGTYTSLGQDNSVVTSTATGAKESDNIAYVPATENLKPYIVTDKFRVRTAKYGISLSGSNMLYGITSYQAWSVSDDTNVASVGSIVGAGSNMVYDAGKGNLSVSNVATLKSDMAATYNTVKNIAGVFTGNATDANSTFNSILNTVASAKTNEAFYADSTNYNIASTKYNGLRKTTGSINYKIYNVTSSSNSSAATGNNTMAISEANSMSVNIYTPVAITDAKINSVGFVNHSNSNSVSIIQQGVTFSVTVSAKKDTAYSSNVYNQITNTGKYIKYWYLMFDFDVSYGGRVYAAETPIKVAAANNAYAETTISGLQAVTTSTDMEIVESTLNKIKVIAGTVNLPSDDYANTQFSRTTASKVDTSTKHIDNENIKQRTSASSPQSQSDGLGMQYDSYYLVSNPQENLSVGRIFDFEITDCLDVNFKDVFRILTSEEETKSSTYSPINVLTGTRYFSGIRRLMVTDSVTSATTNNLVNRGNIDAGAVKKILPLGPYKHTTNTYIKAVKLGYRFSFDLKTSGYYSPKANTSIERYVKITPSYYYISKDGKTYNNNIKIYYKNSSGKYVDFETSNYTIYYKPDDGYRNLYNSSTYQETDVSKTTKDGVTTLTSSLVGLKIGSNQGFTLSDTKSMTISDAGYLQAWYGEFKLPNSAVALAIDASGNVDINNPLTNGYIGVKFNLECVDTYTNNRTVTISYNSNDKGLGNNQVNTSQWDYEGYLGFKDTNVGKELQSNINIQLENGVWSIDAARYKDIKGTVIFYDLDDRAANDYD